MEYLNSQWKRGQAREVAMQTAIHDILITIPLTSYFLQNELSNCYSRDVSRIRVPLLERDFVAFNCETCFASPVSVVVRIESRVIFFFSFFRKMKKRKKNSYFFFKKLYFIFWNK